jgi:hypothetical protein
LRLSVEEELEYEEQSDKHGEVQVRLRVRQEGQPHQTRQFQNHASPVERLEVADEIQDHDRIHRVPDEGGEVGQRQAGDEDGRSGCAAAARGPTRCPPSAPRDAEDDRRLRLLTAAATTATATRPIPASATVASTACRRAAGTEGIPVAVPITGPGLYRYWLRVKSRRKTTGHGAPAFQANRDSLHVR